MNHDDELARLRRRLTEIENRLDRRRPDPVLLPAVDLRTMVVTTTITAMSGPTCGVGYAVDSVFTAGTLRLAAGTGTPVKVYSYHEKRFLSGAIIAAFRWSSVLWVVDVDKCANYAT